jgi:hypothetical protein
MGVINPTRFPGRLQLPSRLKRKVQHQQSLRDLVSRALNIVAEEESTRISPEEKQDPSRFPPPPLVVQLYNPWLHKADLKEAWHIILSCMYGSSQFLQDALRVEWPHAIKFVEPANIEFVPVYNKLDDGTVRFIRQMNLGEGIAWLQAAISLYFPRSDYEITTLPAENEEERVLGVKIYGSLSAQEFRTQRHAMCEAMIKAGHHDLHAVVGVFQRRTSESGSQALSWYSSLSTE